MHKYTTYILLASLQYIAKSYTIFSLQLRDSIFYLLSNLIEFTTSQPPKSFMHLVFKKQKSSMLRL